MGHQMYEVPVIQQDLRQEETILQIADALDYLDQVVKDIFGRIGTRISENKDRLQNVQQRTALAKAKVNKLTGSNKATKVFSSAKYPATEVHKDYRSLFDVNNSMQFEHKSAKIKTKHPPLEGKVLQEKLQFYHVKVSTKLRKSLEIAPEEGLGSLPSNIESINSLLLFNTSENPYKRYVMLDPLGAITKTRQALEEEEGKHMEAAPLSISQREQLDRQTGENYFYSPGLGEVPQIDVPLDLPDLPGIADDLRYSMDTGPMIAPSVSTTPAIPELPNLVPETPTVPENVNAHPLPVQRAQDSVVPELQAHPPPPPAPPEAVMAPPPPPPPPPEVPSPSQAQDTEQQPASEAVVRKDAHVDGDARANLMEAIRKAGGSGKAKLRSVKVRKEEAKKKKQEEKVTGGGGDLMADLHAKLSMRRKGISGANKTDKPDVSGGSHIGPNSAMGRISAMIPPPPRPEASSSTGDDEEEDDWN